MKIVILTTETTHHTFFVREVVKAFPVAAVLEERKILKAPFETDHPFEKMRDAYEKDVFFGSKEVRLGEVAETTVVETANSKDALEYLGNIGPDIIVVFGTGWISPDVIDICPQGIVNLHGGGPEEYRGLDSHLWAIYHKDFEGLVTTLHHLNEKFDDGNIILQGAIPIIKNMSLHEIRRYNTEVCLELTLSALDMHARYGHFISRPQRKLGRYYSFMPAVLKEVCKAYFERYATGLL